VTHHLSAAGVALGPAVTIDSTNVVRETAITARAVGTFVAGWHRRNGNGSTVYGRRLDASGAPVGVSFSVSVSSAFLDFQGVAGTSSGSMFVWRQHGLRGRVFDSAASPLTPEVLLDDFGFYTDVAALPDGGYVALWDLGVRLYNGDGAPRGPATFTGYAVLPRGVAVDPNGNMIIVGIGTGASTNPGGVWILRLDTAGLPVGGPVLVHPAYTEDEIYVPDVDLDLQGNALVVWAALGAIGTQQIRGRSYDTSNAPLGYEFVVADETVNEVRVARLTNGNFVTVWNGATGVTGKILSLCLPSVTQCGDGVVHAACEQCDDGVANSDTTPDACRTNCLLPRCSDGAVDSGEQCDDGNLVNCDGCNATCVAEPGLMCGDGIPEPTCGQPCDDANGTVGDGCTAQCTIEPIPGGGSRLTDCRSVWVVDNPGNDPLLDNHGAFRMNQRCVDDDSTCDFDGGTPGACTFHVRVCANASGMSDCTGSLRIAAWTIDKPTAKQAAANPTLAAIRASFTPVPGVVVGPSTNDTCSDWLAVTVPLRGVPGNYKRGKVTVSSRATLYGDEGIDKDKLKLECMPAGS
jgi:cysteine-rich repeat protein